MKFEIEIDNKYLNLVSIDLDGCVMHVSPDNNQYIVLLRDELRKLYEESDAQYREEEHGKR